MYSLVHRYSEKKPQARELKLYTYKESSKQQNDFPFNTATKKGEDIGLSLYIKMKIYAQQIIVHLAFLL